MTRTRKFVLEAEAPPSRAGEQHVALVTGLRHGRFILDQLGEPSGRKGEFVRVTVAQPGLYERRDVTEYGEVWDSYSLVTADPDGRLHHHGVDFEDAIRIARRLRRGKSITDVTWADAGGWNLSAETPRPASYDDY